jgi:Fe-S cluster assembly protein SufD
MSKRIVRRGTSRTQVASVAEEFDFSSADLQAISQRLNEPEWMAEYRAETWRQYKSMDMPTLKDEPWRRTDIRRLPSRSVHLGPVEELSLDRDRRKAMGGAEQAMRMVVRPGLETDMQGEDTFSEVGVIFCDFPTAIREHGELLQRHMGSIVPAQDGKFAALAAAFADCGGFLYVPEGVNLDEPLHTVIWAPGPGKAYFSRVLVVLEQGARATLAVEYASPTEASGESLHAGIVEASLAEGAKLNFVEMQTWGEHVWNFTHERATIGRDAELDWIYGAVGSQLTKNFTDIDLAGRGSHVRMSGFYLAGGKQHLDHDTQQNHLAANTTSDLLFKGGLVDSSRSVWQGMIYVAPGAQQTDGYQANRNLVLSKKARADSIPGLEILADDVRCSHGATVGRLEEEPIFYLMTRGLPRKQAERLVIDGFFAPIMDRIPFETVRSRLENMIDDKLSAQTGP